VDQKKKDFFKWKISSVKYDEELLKKEGRVSIE
jgi:hypothetical protein